jgi:hypothetical protein
LILPETATDREPTDEENKYVSHLYHEIDKDVVPDQADFRAMAAQSLNIKDKFSQLKDVSDGKFYDLIVQVVREPFDDGDKVTLYLSDYTENPLFFHYTWEDAEGSLAREGDPYGYTTKYSTANTAKKAWQGPYGKKTMQVTCYEPHAGYIRSSAKAGDWLHLRNVQVKYGRNCANLEGYLREDRRSVGKINIAVMDINDPETTDKRLKDAIRCWRDYEKAKKEQIKDIKNGGAGLKRKRQQEKTTLNARDRRNRMRAAKNKKLEEQEAKQDALLGLNRLGEVRLPRNLKVPCTDLDFAVTSEGQGQPVSDVASILGLAYFETTINGEGMKLPLPFTCAKYQANVRVVDFRPDRLEDFARSRRKSDFDCLSEYEGGDSSESESDDNGTLDHFAGERLWQWRFALLLEDASPKLKVRERLWAVVDNHNAQCLTGLDASE